MMFPIHFHLFQILFTILTIISIGIMVLRYKNRKTTFLTLILWTLVWIALLIFAFMPQLSDKIAHHFGIGQGVNLLFAIAIIGCFYLIFHLYDKVDKQEQNINRLVKELAIKNEIITKIEEIEEKEEEKNE